MLCDNGLVRLGLLHNDINVTAFSHQTKFQTHDSVQAIIRQDRKYRGHIPMRDGPKKSGRSILLILSSLLLPGTHGAGDHPSRRRQGQQRDYQPLQQR